MKVTFKATSNTMMQELIGKEGELGYSMTARFSFAADDVSFEFRHGYFTTSQIANIRIEEVSRFCFLITIETNNSTYIFQQGELSDTKPFTKEEKLGIALACMV